MPNGKDTAGYLNVTEFSGQSISAEQLDRICHRYHWALGYCGNKDVLEVGCGGGQGLGLLKREARSVMGSDVSPEVIERAKRTYGDEMRLDVFSADACPLPDRSIDVVLLFEAIYYLPDVGRFLDEMRRILRPGGVLLIATANKDLYDFVPSPFSTRYLGVVELAEALTLAGFSSRFWGYVDTRKVSIRQRILRPVKYLASKLDIIPKTMAGKSILKQIFFGQMALMPPRIDGIACDYVPPKALPDNQPSRHYKVIYCLAEVNGV